MNLEQNKNESQERKRRLEQEMDIGLAAEQERLIKMEMERQQSELKVGFSSLFMNYRLFWTIWATRSHLDAKYRSKQIFKRKSSIWNSAEKANFALLLSYCWLRLNFKRNP